MVKSLSLLDTQLLVMMMHSPTPTAQNRGGVSRSGAGAAMQVHIEHGATDRAGAQVRRGGTLRWRSLPSGCTQQATAQCSAAAAAHAHSTRGALPHCAILETDHASLRSIQNPTAWRLRVSIAAEPSATPVLRRNTTGAAARCSWGPDKEMQVNVLVLLFCNRATAPSRHHLKLVIRLQQTQRKRQKQAVQRGAQGRR